TATAIPDPNTSPTATPTPAATPVAPYRYAIIDLGKDMYPLRINNKGQILVQGVDASGEWANFRWTGATFERLNYAGSYSALYVSDMNDDGAVAGSFRFDGPWGSTTERETGAGLFWPATRATADKIS